MTSTGVSTPPTASVTRAELLRRASALLPVLEERAPKAEERRQIPPETIQDLVSAGLIRVANPDRFGGYGFDVDLSFDLAMELGRACGSTAWCFSIWASHNWMIGQWPLEAQEEYFEGGPDTLSSTSFRPIETKVEPVDGGYRLSGHWDLSSGCDAATWAILGAAVPAGRAHMLVPRSDYTIVDTWFASGLRGTGSNDIVIEDAFVLAHRVLEVVPPGNEEASNGWRIHRRASYRAPRLPLFGHILAAPVIGIAQGAVEEFTSRLQGTSGPGRTADSTAAHLRLAEASAEADAAQLLLRHNTREIIERAARGEAFTEIERARYRRDCSFATRLAIQAVNRIFEGSGGHAVFDSQPMQRFFRDAHVASHQGALLWDISGEGYGRAALGLPPLPAPLFI